jgi:hypothetical protein
MRPRLATTLALALAVASGAVMASTRHGADRDWLCVQRLVPKLSAATFWSGPDPAGAGDWRQEPAVAALVARISPRAVKAEEGERQIDAFAAEISTGETRGRLVTLAFAGLLEETNAQRSALIARIKDLGHRQNELAEIASKATEALDDIPADAVGEAAERRTDLQQRVAFVTRAYEGGMRTLRYVCEAPVQLESRLGRYARRLQAAL